MTVKTLARWIAALLVLSAIAFAFAILIERHEAVPGHQETSTEGMETGTETGNSEAIESHAERGSELFLGINLESPLLVWGFVIVSVLLAGLVLQQWKPAFVITAIISGVAAILDTRETINQFGIANTIALLGIIIALAHAAAAILSVVALTKFHRQISN